MKIRWKHKLRSGALQFTLFISVIIALLLAGIILLAYTHRFFIEQSRAIVDNIQLADTGVIALQQQDLLDNDTITLSLKDVREHQAVNTYLSQWGIFEKGYIRSTHRQKAFTRCILLGSGLKSSDRPAIYLKENFNPLAVVGNTMIKGKGILPEQGIRPGNITGNSYYGTQLIYGTIEKSTPELPKLKYDYKKILDYYLTDYQPQSAESFIALGQDKKIFNSFKDKEKGYFTNTPLILENVMIHGNIIIRSSKKITIRKTAQLKDIILVAPEIVIENDVKGNFQAIADTSLKVGRNCKLSYPSALIIAEKENTTLKPLLPTNQYNNKIFIDTETTIKGTICYFNTTLEERDFKVNVYVGEKSEVVGEIYCEGNLELKAASVSGSVYTNYFISNEGGTTFVNHLYNSQINSEDLPEAFGGLLFENQPKNVMQWLY